jgi:hypothetical protein
MSSPEISSEKQASHGIEVAAEQPGVVSTHSNGLDELAKIKGAKEKKVHNVRLAQHSWKAPTRLATRH